MKKEKIDQLFRNSGSFVKQVVADTLIQEINNEVVEATNYQKKRDIRAAISAFIELDCSDIEIISLTKKHFDVDSISFVSECIMDKRIDKKISEIYKSNIERGMSATDARDYIESRKTEEKLREHKEMLNWPIEKIRKLLDAN